MRRRIEQVEERELTESRHPDSRSQIIPYLSISGEIISKFPAYTVTAPGSSPGTTLNDILPYSTLALQLRAAERQAGAQCFPDRCPQ